LSAEPAPGSRDSPDGTFTVRLRAHHFDAAAAQGPGPDFIKDRFGRFGRLRLVEVSDVKIVASPAGAGPGSADLELTARPTGEARRLWPHRFALFFGGVPIGDGAAPLAGQLYFIM